MHAIRDIEFHEDVAPLVLKLVSRIEEKIGHSHLFSSKKHFGLKFALRLPNESRGKHKKAFRLFLLISPSRTGAVARRPLPPKTGWEVKELSADTIDEIFRAGMCWFYEVQKMKVPNEYQDTENRQVLAGGHFESNRRKH